MSADVAPAIRVSGRHLVDKKGNTVRLAGAMHPFHPYYCGGRWGWGTDDETIKRCYDFYEKIFRAMTDHAQGSYCNMIRMTDDGQTHEALFPPRE